MAKAGEVHSIRLPSGTAAALRERGFSVSKVGRTQILAFLEFLKQEEAKAK